MKIYRAYKFRLYPTEEQRILIHKTLGCSRFVYNYYLNYQKEKIARIYAKIKNHRKHYLNDIANEIVDEHDIIVTENLLVKDMFKDKRKAFNKSLSDACVSTLRSLIEWKCKIKGKIYYKINTYYPSSQICSHCGYKNSKLKDLSIREYDCPECGSHNDRDINASLNILLEGLKLHYNLVSLV